MAAWAGWEQDVLAAGKWPTTPENVRFLTDWHGYEESTCRNNPLNTTLDWTGATICNSAGVKSYDTQAHGAAATVSTLKELFYINIVGALATGDPYSYPLSASVAEEITTWGTPRYAAFYLQQAGGAQQGTTAAPTRASATASGHRGYADLRNSVARHLPAQLRKSRRTGDATLRLFAHHRRVRG